jgi:hypothetical protein
MSIPHSGPSIRRASETFFQARAASQEARRWRMAVQIVDGLLGTLEEIIYNDRGNDEDLLIPGRLRRLETAVGRPLPARVCRARTPLLLHAALLDWQETLLDEGVQARSALRDLDRRFEDDDCAASA